MTFNDELRSLDIDTLTLRCRAESRQPQPAQRLGQQTPCYELLRRAVEEQSSEAWDAIYQQYRRLVLHWIGPQRPDVDTVMNQAFAKFWRSCPQESFSHRFPDLKRVLGYLRQCAITARQQADREQQRYDRLIADNPALVSSVHDSVETVALENVTCEEWKTLIWNRLKDDRERRVMHLSYELDLTPLQITDCYPNEFPSIHEIRRIKERVLKRLRQDTALRALWERQE